LVFVAIVTDQDIESTFANTGEWDVREHMQGGKPVDLPCMEYSSLDKRLCRIWRGSELPL
jgi:hypothetical protein